jgi:hypothetical protein
MTTETATRKEALLLMIRWLREQEEALEASHKFLETKMPCCGHERDSLEFAFSERVN